MFCLTDNAWLELVCRVCSALLQGVGCKRGELGFEG